MITLARVFSKNRHVYYHCTNSRRKCGNTFVREERLAELLAKVVERIQIDPKIAAAIAAALPQSHEDKK